jgi:hypothetical protein
MKRIWKIIKTGIETRYENIKLKFIRWWNTNLNKLCINCSCRVYKEDFENSKCCDWSWRKKDW